MGKVRTLLSNNSLEELASLINPLTCDLAMQKHGFKLDKYLEKDINLNKFKKDELGNDVVKTAEELTNDIIKYFLTDKTTAIEIDTKLKVEEQDVVDNAMDEIDLFGDEPFGTEIDID